LQKKFPIRTISLYVLAASLTLGCAAAVGWFAGILPASGDIPASASPEKAVVFVLDPGHGGEDGGAEAEDGTAEKFFNLDIAMTMEAAADLLGYPSVLTRTEDRMLYDLYGDLDEYSGKKKTYDLRNRLRFAEETDAALFCSIHMNKFPSAGCRGLQVYYSPNTEESRLYASLLQSYGRTFLDPENKREIKKATSSIYLLHRLQIPAVLVECGFLSNPGEFRLLHTPEYRQRMACVLTAALAEGWEAEKTSKGS